MKEVYKISDIFLHKDCYYIEITENESLLIDRIGPILIITKRKNGSLFKYNINLN